MSILGYSTSYFLPEYWGSTPLYGEKIIPLLDYILSTEYTEADKLANAFYMMENKYKNTADLPIEAIEEIINESGYGYVRDLFGDDEESIRLLVYLLVLIHQLKGSKLGIEVVLNLLKKSTNDLIYTKVGNVIIDEETKNASGFSTDSYLVYRGFTTDKDPFDFTLEIVTPEYFTGEECIASSDAYGFKISVDYSGRLLLSLGSDKTSWNIVDSIVSEKTLQPSTSYKIKLTYDGYSYKLLVLKGEGSYEEFITLDSIEPLNIHKGVLYIGVDNSTGVVRTPFTGKVNIGFIGLTARNSTITQWFEEFPIIKPEDTFIISTSLDITTVSSDFFEKFSTFIKKYVYPTLLALEVKFNLENNITFIPYARQRVKYIAATDYKEVTPLTVHPLVYDAQYPLDSGVKCWNPITVLPVTADIDFNINSANIKEGVSILGVRGNVVELKSTAASFNLTNANGQIFMPEGEHNAFSQVTLSAYTTDRTMHPSTTDQTFEVPEGYSGYGAVTVKGVTHNIDNNIKAGNIKDGVEILNVVGNVRELNAEAINKTLTSASATYSPTTGNAFSSVTVTPILEGRSMTPSTSSQTIGVNSNYAGNGDITIGAVTSAIDSNIQAGNIKKDVTILGVTGTLESTGNGITNINDNYLVRTDGSLELITHNTYILGAKDTSITGSMTMAYAHDSTVKSVSFGRVVSISSLGFPGTFANCTNLESVNFSSLVSVEGRLAFSSTFSQNTKLKEVVFPLLQTISSDCFQYTFNLCSNLSLYFPALTSVSLSSDSGQFTSMFESSSRCTVHFPSNLQSVIGSWSDVQAGFGGTNTVVLFDLPATS